MCAQCMMTATTVTAGAAGTRAWLATRSWRWLTAARMKAASAVLVGGGVLTVALTQGP